MTALVAGLMLEVLLWQFGREGDAEEERQRKRDEDIERGEKAIDEYLVWLDKVTDEYYYNPENKSDDYFYDSGIMKAVDRKRYGEIYRQRELNAKEQKRWGKRRHAPLSLAEIQKQNELREKLSLNKTPTQPLTNKTMADRALKEQQILESQQRMNQTLLERQQAANQAALVANRQTNQEVRGTMTDDLSLMRQNMAAESQARAEDNQVISAARQKQLEARQKQELARRNPVKLTGKGYSDLLLRVMTEFNMSKSSAKKYIKKYGSN